MHRIALLALLATAPAAQCVTHWPMSWGGLPHHGLRWHGTEIRGARHLELVPYAGGIGLIAIWDTHTGFEEWYSRCLMSGERGYCEPRDLELRAFWWDDTASTRYRTAGFDRMVTPLDIDIVAVPAGMVLFSTRWPAWQPIVRTHTKHALPAYWAMLLTPQGGSW
jgi:hypothetical protein